MTINLKSVWTSAVRFGSGEQQIACGVLKVSEKKRARSNFASMAFPEIRPSPSSRMSSPQIVLARSRRTGEPESHGGSSTSLFSRKWLVCMTIPFASSSR